MRDRLADDLDAPGALQLVDLWAASVAAGEGDDPGSPDRVRTLLDTLLGVELS